MHSLGLEITDGMDCSTMIIRDASVWDPNLPIQNAIIEVQNPLSDCFYPFSVSTSCGTIPGFGVALSCAQLGICCADCVPTVSTLPDGNYNIKFSVDPNLATMVEFNYFRICELYSSYIASVCTTRAMEKDLRPDEFTKRLVELRGLREMIDSSKWAAEENLDIPAALDLYNEAKRLLGRYNHRSC